jgi:hypothetical protein
MQINKVAAYWPLKLLITIQNFDLKSESSKTILYIINNLMKEKVYKREGNSLLVIYILERKVNFSFY